jgi:hypothetical protein
MMAALAALSLVAVLGGLGLRFGGGRMKAEPAEAGNNTQTSTPAPKSEASGALSPSSPAQLDSSPAPLRPARLQIEIQHHFVIARASVWLDDNLVYQKELQGTTKKHALVLERTLGFDASTVKLPAGPHTVKVRVQSGIDSYDLSKTVSGTLVSGRRSTLQVTCDRQPNLLQVALR